jgi:hypothetical protein
MMRSVILFAAFAVAGCSYFKSSPTTEPTPRSGTATKVEATRARGPGAGLRLATSAGLLKAMHDRYDGKFLKTMSFLQNNTAYTPSGAEVKSQWYEHIEVPGKLRIAFLPATTKSGMVQVENKVASFDNGIRVDFRPSINPLLLLTSDVYVAPVAGVTRDLDSLHVDLEAMRDDEWEGQPVYVVGAKKGDTTSNQMWVDRDHLRLVRFIQSSKAGERTIVSDIRVLNYKEIQGFDIPTEFLIIRNGRPFWREQYADVRINEELPAGTFDQARWNDIPIPK